MDAQLLIDAVVRQVTVLIAQLATTGGVRAPVAHIANQVFVQLARELESQGVSRKVSADMFGMALRAYQRKLRRLTEAASDPGSTLWRAALDFIRSAPLVTRLQVTERFARDEERQLMSVVHDLIEAGLVFRSGPGAQAVYRAATEVEMGELTRLSSEQGMEEWLWVVVYREGLLSETQLAQRMLQPAAELAPALARLLAEGRVQRLPDGRLGARDFVVPFGSARGWEAAVSACGGGLDCMGGICTKSCLTAETECAELGLGVECTNQSVEPGAVAVCDARCDTAADCSSLGSGYECQGGYCRHRAATDVGTEVTGCATDCDAGGMNGGEDSNASCDSFRSAPPPLRREGSMCRTRACELSTFRPSRRRAVAMASRSSVCSERADISIRARAAARCTASARWTRAGPRLRGSCRQ